MISHSELALAVQERKEWLVFFNTSKTRLVTFHRHGVESQSEPILMNANTRKDPGRMVGTVNHFRKYLTPAAMPCLYKRDIRPRTEYCCHNWAAVGQASLSRFNKVQNRLRGLVAMNYSQPNNLHSTDETYKHLSTLLRSQMFERVTYLRATS